MNKILEGVVASNGLAMGPIFVFTQSQYKVRKRTLKKEEMESELVELTSLFHRYENELLKQTYHTLGQEQIGKLHIELLRDPFYLESIKKEIQEKALSVEFAIQEVSEMMACNMEKVDDPYFFERGEDFRDLGRNLIRFFQGMEKKSLEHLNEDCIILAHSLSPSDTATMNHKHVLGIALDQGGIYSHSSILAQMLNIPAIVGINHLQEELSQSSYAILDGEKGILILDPDEELIITYQEKIQKKNENTYDLESLKHEVAISKDGQKFHVACNISDLKDLELGIQYGADGVGLFRTEILFMGRTSFPSEEEQFFLYKKAVLALKGKPLTIRTLDVGGDKTLPFFPMRKEGNPFMGWRALRVSMDYPDIFKVQLKAILRASHFGIVKLLLPMVISMEELLWVKKTLEEMKEELLEEKKAFDPNIEVGIMIETPSAVMLAEAFIQECDFFSIGTNDLTQHILAVDRDNASISHLYNSFHPAVLRAINKAIDACKEVGKPCAMCGSLASNPQATFLLMGMGLDEFSVPFAAIPKIKDLIGASDSNKARRFAKEILSLDSYDKIEMRIQECEIQ